MLWGEFPKFAQGSNNPTRRLPMQPHGLSGKGGMGSGSERPLGSSTQPHSEPTARGASESPEDE